MSAAFIYVMSEGEYGPVKVGVANNPTVRLNEIQIGNPRPLHLARYWLVETRAIAFRYERLALESLAPYRLKGEWIDADEFGVCAMIDDWMQKVNA